MKKRLYKSNNRVISGVCGGIGDYLGLDPTMIRIAWAILTVFTAFSGIIFYIICAIIIPQNPGYRPEDYRTYDDNDQQ
jgi:phage shock protein PspC (stress-responsive transcriptional regulator)